MVHYESLKHNHDCKTLCATQCVCLTHAIAAEHPVCNRSLYDPGRSSLHKSINRIGKKIQEVLMGRSMHTLLVFMRTGRMCCSSIFHMLVCVCFVIPCIPGCGHLSRGDCGG